MNDSDQREGLLPCPFCGNEARYREWNDSYGKDRRMVWCRTQLCQAQIHLSQGQTLAGTWNTRILPERVVTVTDEMVERAIKKIDFTWPESREHMRAALEAAMKGGGK